MTSLHISQKSHRQILYRDKTTRKTVTATGMEKIAGEEEIVRREGRSIESILLTQRCVPL
jgi:hypothetical protein